jgi:hypothetical protein
VIETKCSAHETTCIRIINPVFRFVAPSLNLILSKTTYYFFQSSNATLDALVNILLQRSELPKILSYPSHVYSSILVAVCPPTNAETIFPWRVVAVLITWIKQTDLGVSEAACCVRPSTVSSRALTATPIQIIFDFQEHELVSVSLIHPCEQDAHNSGLH